ncbi:MAG: AAA family ATPase [Lentisphaeraceae bacterium]|nr:AAA family ATPase [Lentisphaeraceae bacterium]
MTAAPTINERGEFLEDLSFEGVEGLENFYVESNDGKKTKRLRKLSHVNLFIGRNSSGKSRLLRTIFSNTCQAMTLAVADGIKIKHICVEISNSFEKCFRDSTYVRFNASGEIMECNKLITFLEANTIDYDYLINLKRWFDKFTQSPCSLSKYENFTSYSKLHSASLNLRDVIDNLDEISSVYLPDLNSRVYIPVLRGMRPIESSGSNSYCSRSINDYFKEVNGITERSLFTGLEIYRTLKSKLLGLPKERKQVSDFQEFISANFFDGKDVTLIPREGKDVVEVKIGEEDQFPIFDLGDGIQNIILLTFPIFMTDPEQHYNFYIEEPDLAMHAGLQRVFLQVLMKFSQHQFFLTTHSNHLLDMTMDFSDISVFLFNKKVKSGQPEFSIRNVSSNDFSILSELGVLNSSVFLSNKTIWVEGLTDRLYLRAYMEMYIHLRIFYMSDKKCARLITA